MISQDSLLSSLSSYIPRDRQVALAKKRQIPVRLKGSALFADISGFTKMTEDLRLVFGARLGAEKLAQQLNQVYDALVDEVDRYGGSVIGFSGDAITCWFGEDLENHNLPEQKKLTEGKPPVNQAEYRATACAFALHIALRSVDVMEVPGHDRHTLSIKVAVASGSIHRYLVGDPDIQVIDVAAGETMLRMAAAEELANKGDVVVDEATAAFLGKDLQISEWRSSQSDPVQRFAVATGLEREIPSHPWYEVKVENFSRKHIRPWLLPAIYERLSEGQGEYLTELRPAVALFMRFGGIDFDRDSEAGKKLDAYISWVQTIVERYAGALIQLTIGEKGSYLYIAFGAPVAHDDDPWRAASTALELRNPPPQFRYIQPIQIGISQGMMRTGSYGSRTRRTYGVLGDDVNLAARLMQTAGNGHILVSAHILKSLGSAYSFQPLAPVTLKGKSKPVPVSLLLEKEEQHSEQLFSGQLVGRKAELQMLKQAVAPILEHPGRFAGIAIVDGEAGMGKSRLVHELHISLEDLQATNVFRSARQVGGPSGIQWFNCPGEHILHQSLYPFRHFLRQYFEQNPNVPESENKARFERMLDALIQRVRSATTNKSAESDPRFSLLANQLERTRSVLGALVDLHWEGSLYERLEPKLRFENSLLAFKTLIMAEAQQYPVIIYIEDSHSLDSDSLVLLQNLVRGVDDIPFALVLSGRYCDANDPDCLPLKDQMRIPRVYIHIKELSQEEVSDLAKQSLAQHTGYQNNLDPELAKFLIKKTNGNPLFLEQILLELHERDLIRSNQGTWQLSGANAEELPASITAMMIARLDRLETPLRSTVQTAAVLGTEFEAPILWGMMPDISELPRRVRDAQERGIWMPSDEHYLFRQSLLRDAAYDMQPQIHLQELHSLAATAIEAIHHTDLEPYYTDLAYHFDLAHKLRRALAYYRLAGNRAAAQYANNQAVENFRHALRLADELPAGEARQERLAILLALGELLVSIGKYSPKQNCLEQALELATEIGDRIAQACACRWLARYSEMRSDYTQSLDWVQRGLKALGDLETPETCDLLSHAGLVHTRLGNSTEAQVAAERSLAIAEHLGDLKALGRANNLLGHIARLCGDYPAAIQYFQRSVDCHQQVGDIYNLALAQNQLAIAWWNMGRWQDASKQFSQARQTFDQIGDLYHRAFCDNNLGDLTLNQGRLDDALNYFQQGLSAAEQSGGSTWVLGGFHNNLGATYIRRGDAQSSLHHLEASQQYFDQAQARDWLPELNRHKAAAYLLMGNLDQAEIHANQALELARQLRQSKEEGCSLRLLGQIALARGDFESATFPLTLSLEKLASNELENARSLIALAHLQTAQGELDARRETLEKCIPILEKLGAELDLLEARSMSE
jgi:adenylate cyclase